MDGKTVNNSSVILRHIVQPQDANLAGITHGGVVMKNIDDAAGVVAVKHSGCAVVTASIDRMDFHHPVIYRQPPHHQGQHQHGGKDVHGNRRPGRG